MTSMNISLPEELKSYVDGRIRGRYGNASEYIRELIRRDQREQGDRELDEMILKGIDSPVAAELSDENRDAYWAAKLALVRERLERRASGD